MHAASTPEWADIEIRLDFGVGVPRLKAEAASEDSRGAMVFIPRRDGSVLTEATGDYVPACALKTVISVQEKRLSLVARENSMGGLSGTVVGRELWRVEVAVEDAGTTFEQVLPVLAGALMPHIDRGSEAVHVERVSRSAAIDLLAAGGS
jgi:hypothetical protein